MDTGLDTSTFDEHCALKILPSEWLLVRYQPYNIKPRLHLIHVAEYMYPGRTTCIGYRPTSGYMSRDDNFVTDTRYIYYYHHHHHQSICSAPTTL